MGSSGLWRVFSLHGCSSQVFRVKERALVDYGEQESASNRAQPLPCAGEEALWSLNGVWDDPSSPFSTGEQLQYMGSPQKCPQGHCQEPLTASTSGSVPDGVQKSTQGPLFERPGPPPPCWSLNN